MRSSLTKLTLICSFCSLLCLAPPEGTAQNLVLQWTFDQASGDAIDTGAVAPPANGVLGAGAVRSTDTPGGGPGFSIDLTAPGAGSTVNGGDPTKVNTLEQFTLTTWMKMTGDNNVDQGGSNNVRLLSRQAGNDLFDGFSWNLNPPNEGGTTTSPDDFRMGLFIGGANAFGFAYANADIEGQGNEWTFVAVSYDGTVAENNMNFYWGDEDSAVMQLGSTVTASSNPGVLFNEAPADFGVGFTSAALPVDTSLLGLQDDIRVYDGLLDLATLDQVRLANLPTSTVTPGDFNGDGTVDAADYTVWRNNLGADESVLNGNGDNSGSVDGGDYTTWKENFGDTSGAALTTAAVPEPNACLLLALAGAALGAARRGFRQPAA